MEDSIKKRKQSVRLMIELFLKDDDHKQLFLTAQRYPTPMNRQALDDAFRHFFTRMKTVQYISKLIKGYSVDFDKRIRNQPLVLSLDDDGKTEDSTSFLQMIQAGDVLTDVEKHIDEEGSITELFTNKQMTKAFTTLKNFQQSILIYSYFYGYQNKEIALILDMSEQRISYNKKRALALLKSKIATIPKEE
ncbi:sigma-70 family RNA polymerase sigma factor [Alkalihalobacillus sp. LMS6]|uniref:sigma factor-like helix-turn-helix DNA-binding protein n=1 Tax=Bacillaceae TaxID=186817 RepID=UPI000C07563D|nr:MULTISPECIES: sigma factor-like helix-turn-helix DNA-binding protein [Bacillaceae]UTR05799.1 sigma-70 family RNA polymerase sigma factor [Alkalihalobacillus sp. LMS6]